ncbi:hypothetical protein OC834_007759 [Tilletia horrida]|nr:hypothetical protein OC834_007759 [Tilletia horrida]
MAKTRQIEVKHLSELSAAEKKKSKRKDSVVRTAGTVSLIPASPRFRRIHIVLKMSLNPMSVVIGFDLDQVAVGYTRDEVWMMPRCARALVTGYTTFTMDLIHGHVFEPRSTTEQKQQLLTLSRFTPILASKAAKIRCKDASLVHGALVVLRRHSRLSRYPALPPALPANSVSSIPPRLRAPDEANKGQADRFRRKVRQLYKEATVKLCTEHAVGADSRLMAVLASLAGDEKDGASA